MKIRSFLKTHFIALCLFLIAAHSAFAQIKIMPLGDSITKGAVDPAPSLSGYRAQLFNDLNQAGIKFLFVGCTTNNSSQILTAAGQQWHNGYGSYRIDDIYKNLDGFYQPGHADKNMGGYWLTGGESVHREASYPDIVLLLAGTNDLGQHATVPVLEARMADLLKWFQTNRSQAQVFVATVPPRGANKPGFETYNPEVAAFNTWLATNVPALGANFHLVDLYSLFVEPTGQVKTPDSPDGIFLKDGIHPSHNGYVAMGDAWFQAIKPLLGQGSSAPTPKAP